jgi:putative flippase GtrA
MTMRSPENFRGHIAPPPQLVRWCKFNLVGGIGIGVQFAALLLVKGVLHFNYMAATAIAVEAAVVHNFVWHEQFTWADRTMMPTRSDRTVPPPPSQAAAEQSAERRGVGWRGAFSAAIKPLLSSRASASAVLRSRYGPTFRRLLRFNFTTGAVSLLGNLALMKVMVGQGHMNYLLANAIAIVSCSLANFLVSETWVFEEHTEKNTLLS